MEEAKIVVVEPNYIVRFALSKIIEENGDILSSICNTLEEAIKIIENKQEHVNIIITEIQNQIVDIQYINKIKSIHPDIKVIILTLNSDFQTISSSIKNGTDGYILKNDHVDDIINAIQSVKKDRFYYSAGVTRILANQEKYENDIVYEVKALTHRELEVIKLISQDMSTSEIADKLCISESTLNTHRKNILQKISVKSNVGIALFARTHGIY